MTEIDAEPTLTAATADLEISESNSNSSTVEVSVSTPPPCTIGNILTDVNSRFPCIEQPTRVTLHCNGYYLWCKKNGKVIVRKRRNEKDEFCLQYNHGYDDEQGNSNSSNNNNNNQGIVQIKHHKFGGIMTVVCEDLDNGDTRRSVICIKKKEEESEDITQQQPDGLTLNASTGDEDDDEDDDGDVSAVQLPSSGDIHEEDQKFCFIKVANSNNVMLKSLSTGLNLGISDDGRLAFGHDNVSQPRQIMWTIECVTGELCFMSNANPALNRRVRCDMAGLLSLSDNAKGWEVFRFMEASHGYVKISSWMHSQWLLYSTKDGRVGTCSHAESFQDYRQDDNNGDTTVSTSSSSSGEIRCCKWAIEKCPSGGNGVVIRSKTHGRYLSVLGNGELRTYHSDDETKKEEESGDSSLEVVKKEQQKKKASGGGGGAEASWKSFKDTIRTGFDDVHKSMQKRKQNIKDEPVVRENETLLWQLEAAHSQTYYFLSLNLEDPDAKAKSVGPFPQVTPNLRKNTKVQLIQEDDNITKLSVEQDEKHGKDIIKKVVKKFIACAADGSISLVDDVTDINTEWIMDKSQYQEGGTYFKSRRHNRYLSYQKNSPSLSAENNVKSKEGKFKDFFQKEKENAEELYGSETFGMQETWKLDPCMPRAVSSDKIKTFALGTSIAVGTTVAMPFALAGVGALMGAIGAEVGTFTAVVFAGLTGMEAIASVGAIGATAYIVFRPAENSLTDDHQNEEEAEEEIAWSKRPLSNWRNW